MYRVQNKYVKLFIAVNILVLSFFAWYHTKFSVYFLETHGQGMVSKADILIDVYNSWHLNYFSLAMIMLSSLFFIKSDFRYYNVIAYGSKKHIWFTQIKRIYIYEGCAAVCFWGVVLAFTNQYMDVEINWNEISSRFFKVSKQLTDERYENVVIAVLASFIFMNIAISTLYLLLCWIFENQILVWIIVIGISFVFNKIIKYSPLLQVEYMEWLNSTVIWSFLVTVLLIVVLHLIGFYFIKHKEFYKS